MDGKATAADEILKPPGHLAAALIETLLPKKMAEPLLQHIRDMRVEYYDLLSEKRIKTAKWKVFVYHVLLVWMAGEGIIKRIAAVLGYGNIKNNGNGAA